MQMPDFCLSLAVQFVPYMNHAFSIDSDPATSSRGTRPSVTMNERDMTAEHGSGCHCDELKHSVDKSECIDDRKQFSF